MIAHQDSYLNRIDEIKTPHAIIFAYIAYIMYCISYYLGTIDQGSVIISYIIMALVPFGLSTRYLSVKVFLLASILLLYPFCNQTIPIFFLFYFVFIFRRQSIENITWITFILICVFLICQAFLLDMGIVKNETSYIMKGETNSFGFMNSNVFAAMIMYLNMCIYILTCKKHIWSGSIIILLINQYVLFLTSSRTPWLATIALVATAIFIKTKIITNSSKYLFACLPTIFTVLCYYFVNHASDFPELDFVLSGRLILLNEILSRMSISNWLFGLRLNPDDMLDCAYIGLVVNGGIAWLALFLIATTSKILKHFHQIKIYMPIIMGMLVGGLAENTFCGYKPLTVIFWLIILTDSANRCHKGGTIRNVDPMEVIKK